MITIGLVGIRWHSGSQMRLSGERVQSGESSRELLRMSLVRLQQRVLKNLRPRRLCFQLDPRNCSRGFFGLEFQAQQREQDFGISHRKGQRNGLPVPVLIRQFELKIQAIGCQSVIFQLATELLQEFPEQEGQRFKVFNLPLQFFHGNKTWWFGYWFKRLQVFPASQSLKLQSFISHSGYKL